VLARTDHAGQAGRDGFRLSPTQTLLIDHGSDGARSRLVIWQARSGVTVVKADEPAGVAGSAVEGVAEGAAGQAPEQMTRADAARQAKAEEPGG
jgi:hypothetical protein